MERPDDPLDYRSRKFNPAVAQRGYVKAGEPLYVAMRLYRALEAGVLDPTRPWRFGVLTDDNTQGGLD